MKCRALSLVLVVMLTPVGVGLPRFVHMMTAHLPSAGSFVTVSHESRTAHACTLQCCAFSRPLTATLAQEEANDADETKSSHSDGPHHCPVCEMLATLLTSVPELPAASIARRPLVVAAAEFTVSPLPAGGFDPHAPRGPPAAA